MRVLDFLTHPPYQYNLCKTGHRLFFATSAIYQQWPEGLRPLPPNAELASPDVDPDEFDVVIVATREQYHAVRHRAPSERIVFISHTVLHPWDGDFFRALPQDVELVYVSDHKRASFGDIGHRGRTIRLAVDTETEFAAYTGHKAAVLNVTNRYAQQGDRDYPLFERLTEGLPSQVVGHGNEGIPGAYPACDFAHLLEVYRTHRCFLNTDPQGRLHLSTLEAMGTGMPLVTVPIAELAPYLEHGVNCFVSEDEGELRAALEMLLEDHELAARVGARGREVVREHFGIDRFIDQWNELLEQRASSAKPEGARGGRVARTDGGVRVAINALSVGGEMTGIGHHARNLVQALSRAQADQVYLVLTGQEDGYPPDARFEPVRVGGPAPLWEQLELPELLTERRVDVYHNPAFGLPVVKSCKYVCTVHDCIPRLFPEYAPAWLRDFFQRWAPTWMRLADHIICISQHTRHDIMHLYAVEEDRISVVYQAADDVYQRVTDRELMRSAQSGYGIDRPYVLCVGRVELRKNVAGLLRAFQALREEHGDDLLLVFAGPRDADVYDPEGLLPLPGRHGDVLVTGYVPSQDLAALYSGCEVFCFPSFYEGFGIPVLEAMQCGAPVVTSRVSSLPEVAGEAALYANPYDPEDIADKLLQVLTDAQLREQISQRGLAEAQRFSLQRCGEQTAAVYERVAAG